jgi:hypothetical protein
MFRMSLHPRPRANVLALAAVLVLAAGLLLAAQGPFDPHPTAGTDSPVVPIDLFVGDGHADTLRLVPGVVYRIDQIDLTATDRRPEDDGLHALMTRSAFAPLDWRGLSITFSDTARGLDGRPFLREIYRDALWMTGDHRFTVTPLDGDGDSTGAAILLKTGGDQRAIPVDDFPIRRPVVIRDHRDGLYQSEALFQLRNASSTVPAAHETFQMTADTRSLDLVWEAPAAPLSGETTARLRYRVPVVPAADPPFAYGFRFELEFVNPPPNGVYAPGEEVALAVTFRDGQGNRLHPPGSLPTYNEFRRGLASGLRYYDFYPSVLYFKDKNKEGVLLIAFAGPEERVRQSYSEVPPEEFGRPQQVVAETERDGYACIWQLLPPANVLLGGLVDSTLWDTPVSDQIRFRVPIDALPGTYRIVGKARRAYLGESSLVTSAVTLEVAGAAAREGPADRDPAAAIAQPRDQAAATAQPLKHHGPFAVCPAPADEWPAGEWPATDPAKDKDNVLVARGAGESWVGKCKDCHADGFRLEALLHGNGETATCAACHAPMFFEPDNMLAYRVHYLHFFSRRYQGGGKTCAACHYRPESVERASLLVCLACHVKYHGGGDVYGNYQSCAFSKCHAGAHDQF